MIYTQTASLITRTDKSVRTKSKWDVVCCSRPVQRPRRPVYAGMVAPLVPLWQEVSRWGVLCRPNFSLPDPDSLAGVDVLELHRLIEGRISCTFRVSMGASTVEVKDRPRGSRKPSFERAKPNLH